MVILFSVGLLVMVALLVAYPFIKNESEMALNAEGSLSLEDQRQVVFTALNEIEFDYQMNKLSHEDYEELQNQYKKTALELLKTSGTNKEILTLDALEEEIEKEIKQELEGKR